MPIPAEWTLRGKVVLLAAGNRGWDATLAEGLAQAGAEVAIVGASDAQLKAAVDAAAKHGHRAEAFEADLTQPDEVREAVLWAEGSFGKIDALVNDTQVEFAKPMVDITPEEFDRVMAQNVRSVFLLCQEVGRHMLKRGGGQIVNITSGLAERGLGNGAAYCSTMGALQQLTQALALEWGKQNIRVNGIGPGWFSHEDTSLEEQRKELYVRYLPMRRLGHPRELVPLLVYLCSDACAYTTGQTLYLDGGALSHA
ncbi:MAG: SDR family oxidoreductase [Dehalococcoidia bacterium]|nr:SDR family oxidoreductase [Dehalococcoidia bacterium]